MTAPRKPRAKHEPTAIERVLGKRIYGKCPCGKPVPTRHADRNHLMVCPVVDKVVMAAVEKVLAERSEVSD